MHVYVYQQEGGFLCKLQAGTLLGAVKFNSVLPWELDADIIIHCNNFTAFGAKYKSFLNISRSSKNKDTNGYLFSTSKF